MTCRLSLSLLVLTFLVVSGRVAVAVPDAAPPTQQQPRDVRRDAPTGTASLSGVVLTEEAQPKPLRRVRVTLNNSERTFGETAITNDRGEFSFERLAAGRYLVSGVKAGFVTMHHGARRPNRPGVSLALAKGETRTITLRLPPGGVITGTVLDPDGLPAPGINVEALTHRLTVGLGRRPVSVGSLGGVTDDRGEYRIFGLPPGDYIVSARPAGPAGAPLQVLSQTEIRRALADLRETRQNTRPGPPRPPRRAPLPEEPRRSVSLAEVMYPGTTNLTHAATVTLSAGEQRAGIDIQLQHVPIAGVQGTVFAPNGPVGRVTVSLFLPGEQLGSSLPLEHYRTMTASREGEFSFSGIPPGHYTVKARTIPNPSAPDQWASTEVVLDGHDVTGVVLSLQDGLTIGGRIAFDSEHPPEFDLAGLELELPMHMAGGVPSPASRARVQLNSDGGFVLAGVTPGLYMLADGRGVRWPIGSWWLQSITIGGRDILDAPLSLTKNVNDALVTFADRTSEISGRVSDAEGQPSADGFVVVFGADRASWFQGSRRVAGIRPTEDGRYRFRNLPPGDYLILAHDDVEDGEWGDAALLARLAPQAVRMTIEDFEKTTLNLVLPRR